MKKLLVTLIALGFSSVAMAGIGETGAPHNFYDNQCGDSASNYWSYAGCNTNERLWNDSGEICKVCHIPHRTAEDIAGNNEWAKGALWNHVVTTQPFTPYDDAGLYGNITFAGNQPQGSSKLCLSCHDGVTALDSFDTSIATAGANINTFLQYSVGANVEIGTDLGNHHPVSVSYEVGTAAAQLKALNTVMGSGNIADYLENDGSTDLVQCGTCHDPHGDRTTGSPNSLLRVVNSALDSGIATDASKLCLTCHDK